MWTLAGNLVNNVLCIDRNRLAKCCSADNLACIFSCFCCSHHWHEVRLPVRVGPASQHVDTCVGDEQSVFELGRQFAILSDGSPVIRPLFIFPRTWHQIFGGLD